MKNIGNVICRVVDDGCKGGAGNLYIGPHVFAETDISIDMIRKMSVWSFADSWTVAAKKGLVIYMRAPPMFSGMTFR
jgi:hypothetical protein